MKYYYKVLGYDRANKDYYRLCFTSNKRQAEKYYRSFGWNKKDLTFERIEK